MYRRALQYRSGWQLRPRRPVVEPCGQKMGLHSALAVVVRGLQQDRRFPRVHGRIMEVQLGHGQGFAPPWRRDQAGDRVGVRLANLGRGASARNQRPTAVGKRNRKAMMAGIGTVLLAPFTCQNGHGNGCVTCPGDAGPKADTQARPHPNPTLGHRISSPVPGVSGPHSR